MKTTIKTNYSLSSVSKHNKSFEENQLSLTDTFNNNINIAIITINSFLLILLRLIMIM